MDQKYDSAQSFCSFWCSLLVSIALVLTFWAPVLGQENGQNQVNTYVGSLACKECHPEEYENFMTYAKKSVFFQAEGRTMSEKYDWSCWEIMNCDESKKYLAKTRPETPCWEITKEVSDYRHTLDKCTDCIVHMLKADNPVLPKKIEPIMAHKENCVLT